LKVAAFFELHSTTDEMTQATLNPFRFPRHESVNSTRLRHLFRRLGSRAAGRAIAAILALTIAALPVASAFAGESVLEIPPVGGGPAVAPLSSSGPAAYGSPSDGSGADAIGTPRLSSPDSTSGSSRAADPPSTVSSNTGSYPPVPNVGSIEDYQNQAGENRQPAGISFGGGARPNEPQRSMTTELILGGLLVGMVALELASHHHR
jgi:hypothetical protein